MQNLVSGIHHFQTYVFRSKKDLFQKLRNKQQPTAIFITCSDSRINPNMLTHTEPGDIFVLRNAGNIIPPAPQFSGEIATIEFAVVGLDIKDIIICGHQDCGAMKFLLQNQPNELMPSMSQFLQNAAQTRAIIKREYSHLHGDSLIAATIQENIIVQLQNLRSHPFIEERLRTGKLNLHGWYYKFETGDVFSYDSTLGQFDKLKSSKETFSTDREGDLS